VWFWGRLNRRGLEPSTPTKIACGMLFCAAGFAVLSASARIGEHQSVTPDMLAAGDFHVTDRTMAQLERERVPEEVIEDLGAIKGKKFRTDRTFEDALGTMKEDFAEDAKQARADLKRWRDEDKYLQARLRQAGEEDISGDVALAAHRARKKALEERLRLAEQDENAFKSVKIKDGSLPPPDSRGPDGNQEFAEEIGQVVGSLSPAGAARARRWANRTFTGHEKFERALARPGVLGPEDADRYGPAIEEASYLFKVSPFWLFLAYAIMTLGELMLSPMGLSLVSKVAPVRLRGLMMGGWFVATALGGKLSGIAVYWDVWAHSTFFAVLTALLLVTALVLFLILRPLKKSMPGV
jgi:hypothetical protein